MMVTLCYLIDRLGPALLFFTLGAALAAIFTRTKALRVAAGGALIGAGMLASISHRNLLEWCTSALDRLSLAGFVMLALLAFNAVTSRTVKDDPEYRFGAGVLALAGLALYASATGLIDYDAYVLGYDGFVLPAILAAIIAYAAWRRYWIVVAVIDVSIAACVFGWGRSFNLWDYLLDPIAALIGLLSWLAVAVFAWMAHRHKSLATSPAS